MPSLRNVLFLPAIVLTPLLAAALGAQETYLRQAKANSNAWVDVEKPFWWDAPLWVASGQIDSIGIANNHMQRGRMLPNEAWGKPRDVAKYPAPKGNGFWTQEIYYHFLNCGYRIPPSAGSASGVLPNPVGHNRVYVHLEGGFEYRKWWEGLKLGRSFVSNGPLLRCRANGELPGAILKRGGANPWRIEIVAELDSRTPIEAIEVVQNGSVAQRFAPAEFKAGQNKLAVDFERSGWFLIRALAQNERTFEFASTAPFYVEMDAAPARISRGSVQFFLNWIGERKGRIRLANEAQRAEVLRFHEEAEAVYRGLLDSANAD